jgi:superfamily II DNA or RNA helicase
LTLPPNVSRADLERLYGALFQPGGEIDELSRYSRNSGFVEKVVVGASAAQGRVRGRRRDTGFNVRIHYSGTFSCKCPRARKQPCEHVGALLLHVIAQLSEASATGATKLNPQQPAPEVYQFLLDLFPGIGPKRAKEVARVFRTVPDLLQATPRQLRNLPEIGVWAAQVLHEHLQKHQQIGFRAVRPKDDDAEPAPQSKPDVAWLQEGPKVEIDATGDARTRLHGSIVLVQGTRTGSVFFRPAEAKDPLMRRALKHIRKTDPGSFRPSLKHHIWTTDQERFPRVIGRLEAMGARREHTHLVDLPLDGLTLFFDAAGRRARFQFTNEALEEGFPRALDMLKSADGYAYDEASAQHLVLPKAFPQLKSELSDLGALLIRKRLRPVREIAEWKEEEPEDLVEGTPRIRPLPDIAPFLNEPLPASLKAHVQLRPYQRAGVAFIRATDYLTYLGDPPGLGKTITAITAALYLPGRILVIAPAGARDVWKREIESWTTESVFVFRPTSKKTPTNEKFVVASYDALLSRQDQLLKVKPDLVILDEAHYVKNKEAERTKAVHDSLISIPRRLLLSGTPAMNRVDEVRKQLEFIHPGEWGDEAWFRHRFVQPLEQGTPEVRMKVLARLREYFQGVMLRRQKADVLRDLPPKHVIVQNVKLPPLWRQEYNEEAGRLREHINTHRETAFGDDYGTTRSHVMTLRQLASNGKGEAAEAYVRSLLRAPGEKVVLFSYYLQHLETLEKALAEFNPVTVHGGVNDKQRDAAVQAFQHDPAARVFLGQITAAGTALTLTAARHAVFVDLDWNPANHEQAGDRIHRIGQTREVFLHYLVAGGTIDEDIVKMLQEKSTTTAALLDADEQSAGLLQQRRESRNVARLALKVAMGELVPAAPA